MTVETLPKPLTLSAKVVVDPPVVLAPMAGITNLAFRRLAREATATQLGDRRGALFVSEMITSRALVEGNEKTMRLIRFGEEEQPRSIQLYGVDPVIVGEAARKIVANDWADHIDLNFGCPVPKVTRKGGGAALPWHTDLFSDIVEATVKAAGGAVPVTVKMRIGIDDEHVTFREAGLRAQDAGAAHVALHGRTAAQFYGGQANWERIAELVQLLDIPVLGNGDIWEADDALRMVRETGCAGVVVGRGCLGRPWLFADLAAAFAGNPQRSRPDLAQVAATMFRHAELLADFVGEDRGLADFRKHVAWYLKGFSVGGELRTALAMVHTLDELRSRLELLDVGQPFPTAVLGQPRGRTTGGRAVSLPQGWLESRSDRSVPLDAELPDSGG
ncbi:putative TIM-barrel protein, nifR3 family [Frankineae bacterium MT45]|nr:putative TIM-barrel protein, nifR3 family [Frankineae bacterium MT45]